MVFWRRRKTDQQEGRGEAVTPTLDDSDGPSFDAPEPGVAPYVPAGNGWAAVTKPIPAQWQDAEQGDSRGPADENMGDWDEYTTNSQRLVFQPQEHTLYSDEGPAASQVRKTRTADPRWYPPLPDRIIPTPSNYRFLRPFMQWGAKTLTGDHFSMADNIRMYPVGGMRPASERNRRNTYRLSPPPWDENIVDMPQGGPRIELEDGQFDSYNVIPRGRSFRLG